MAHLLRSQLNELVRLALHAGIGSGALNFSEDLSKSSFNVGLPFRIWIQDMNLFFTIGYSEGQRAYSVEFFPSGIPRSAFALRYKWSQVTGDFSTWLERIQKELAEPDPWLLRRQGNILLGEIPLDKEVGEAFEQHELRRLHEFTQALRQFLISEVTPSAEQLRLIEERLHYLEESAKRQNKKDWAHTAIGTIVTIAVGLAMSPEQAHKLFTLTSEFVNTLFMKLLR